MTRSRNRKRNDPRRVSATCQGRREPGDVRVLPTYLRRPCRKLGDGAGDPSCIFNKRRVGYWMESAEGYEPNATGD